MREFFRGWRRKVGCGLLVLASAFAGLWWRSTQADDAFRIMIGGRKHILRSHQQRIDWWAWIPTSRDSGQPFWTSEEYLPLPEHGLIRDGLHREWMHYDLSIMGLYRDELPYSMAARWTIPFWPICWTAIAVSAYLLLWKPRPKPKATPNA